jgi:chromosome segregation ATPase
LRDELNHVNDQIAKNINLLKDKEGRIAYLHRENDISRANQGGLKGSIAGKTADCNATLDQIADRNVKLDVLNRDIDRNLYTINDLRRKIADESEVTNHVNYDNGNYAVRNSDLSSLVASLKCK